MCVCWCCWWGVRDGSVCVGYMCVLSVPLALVHRISDTHIHTTHMISSTHTAQGGGGGTGAGGERFKDSSAAAAPSASKALPACLRWQVRAFWVKTWWSCVVREGGREGVMDPTDR